MEFFDGVDWAEEHHDVCVLDAGGRVRTKGRVSNDLVGVAKIHDLIGGVVADEVDDRDDAAVTVGIETGRGLLVRALIAAGYRVLAVNPLAADRSRDRHGFSRAKSDAGYAKGVG